MEKRNLPNATTVLILGIVSICTCCCSIYGIGLVAGIVALVLANKDLKLYLQNPDLYVNYGTLNTGKILAIIGTTLSALTFIFGIFFELSYTEEEKMDFVKNLQEKVDHMEKQNQ